MCHGDVLLNVRPCRAARWGSAAGCACVAGDIQNRRHSEQGVEQAVAAELHGCTARSALTCRRLTAWHPPTACWGRNGRQVSTSCRSLSGAAMEAAAALRDENEKKASFRFPWCPRCRHARAVQGAAIRFLLAAQWRHPCTRARQRPVRSVFSLGSGMFTSQRSHLADVTVITGVMDGKPPPRLPRPLSTLPPPAATSYVGEHLREHYNTIICVDRSTAGLGRWAAEVARQGTFAAPLPEDRASVALGALPVPYLTVANKADLAGRRSASQIFEVCDGKDMFEDLPGLRSGHQHGGAGRSCAQRLAYTRI